MFQYLKAYQAFHYIEMCPDDTYRSWHDLNDIIKNDWIDKLPEYYALEKKFIKLYMMFYDFCSREFVPSNGDKACSPVIVQLRDITKCPFFVDYHSFHPKIYSDLDNFPYKLISLLKKIFYIIEGLTLSI